MSNPNQIKVFNEYSNVTLVSDDDKLFSTHKYTFVSKHLKIETNVNCEVKFEVLQFY